MAAELSRPSSALSLIVLFTALFGAVPTFAMDCHARELEAGRLQVLVPSGESGRQIIGKVPASMYSAPDASCISKVNALRPGVTVIAYSEYNGFTSVLYINLKTGDELDGWVVTARLRETGTGIGPNH